MRPGKPLPALLAGLPEAEAPPMARIRKGGPFRMIFAFLIFVEPPIPGTSCAF